MQLRRTGSVLISALLALVVVSVILVTYVFISREKSAPSKQTQNSQGLDTPPMPNWPQPSPKATASPVRQSVADPKQIVLPPETKIPGWLTYTNTVFKYTVQYPANWKIDSSQANNVETYQSSICCNSAYLKISNGTVSWDLSANVVVTGFQAPAECDGDNYGTCARESKPIVVLAYPLERVIYRSNKLNKIVQAYVGVPNGHPGFGQVGIATDWIRQENIKYFLDYHGTDLDKYLGTLDTISTSLRPL